jgi:hypothetical protein
MSVQYNPETSWLSQEKFAAAREGTHVPESLPIIVLCQHGLTREVVARARSTAQRLNGIHADIQVFAAKEIPGNRHAYTIRTLGNPIIKILVLHQIDKITALYVTLFELINIGSMETSAHIYATAREGNLGEEDFVRKIEALEYESLHSVNTIMQKLREEGVPPWTATISSCHRSFDEYFTDQQRCGHSQVYQKFWQKHYAFAYRQKHPSPKLAQVVR